MNMPSEDIHMLHLAAIHLQEQIPNLLILPLTSDDCLETACECE